MSSLCYWTLNIIQAVKITSFKSKAFVYCSPGSILCLCNTNEAASARLNCQSHCAIERSTVLPVIACVALTWDHLLGYNCIPRLGIMSTDNYKSFTAPLVTMPSKSFNCMHLSAEVIWETIPELHMLTCCTATENRVLAEILSLAQGMQPTSK